MPAAVFAQTASKLSNEGAAEVTMKLVCLGFTGHSWHLKIEFPWEVSEARTTGAKERLTSAVKLS